MKNIQLKTSLGNIQADTIMQEVIELYEKSFSEQIAAYYVEGSYANQTYLATSDIDMVIVFREQFAHENTQQTAEQTWVNDQTKSHEVDISIMAEESLRKGVHPNLKLGGLLLYGEDICQRYPLLPIEDWTRDRMHAAYWLMTSVYQRPQPVRQPLPFPAEQDEFYGYTNRTIRLPNGREVPCTRNLVRTTGWTATALLAFQARQYSSTKRDCTKLYRQYIGDTWSSLHEDIANLCRDRWHYLIPADPQERLLLRKICEQTLGFERHFLNSYKTYLLEQLRSADAEAVRFALWVQNMLRFEDEEVIEVLQTVSQQQENSN